MSHIFQNSGDKKQHAQCMHSGHSTRASESVVQSRCFKVYPTGSPIIVIMYTESFTWDHIHNRYFRNVRS